jgi:hypothetical protein
MSLLRIVLVVVLMMPGLVGCGDEQAVIPTTELTQEQKDAIKAEDAKVADEESHGAKKL